MAELLVDMHVAVTTRNARGKTALPVARLAGYRRRYKILVAESQGLNPLPPRAGKRGRPALGAAGAVLRRLDIYSADVLRFATDFRVPFDNNQAERDICMVKLQQKISGGWRSHDAPRLSSPCVPTCPPYGRTIQQRGLKRHPVGGLTGEGRSPPRSEISLSNEQLDGWFVGMLSAEDCGHQAQALGIHLMRGEDPADDEHKPSCRPPTRYSATPRAVLAIIIEGGHGPRLTVALAAYSPASHFTLWRQICPKPDHAVNSSGAQCGPISLA